MFNTISTLILSALSIPVDGKPAGRDRPCVDFDVAVPVKANNSLYDITRVDSDTDAAEFTWDLTRWSAPNITDRIRGVRPVDETFSISARLCVPENGAKKSTLHIPTHGIAFDKRYWDAELEPEKHSYVDATLAKGYSILIYDRLGVGKSDKPDAYEVVQAPVQLEILRQLTVMAKDGRIAQAAKKLEAPKFEKLVLVGHSFGTALTHGALSAFGETIDAGILTGLIPGSQIGGTTWDAFGWSYAATNRKSWKDRTSGYIAQKTRVNFQFIFFKKGGFAQKALDYADEILQPATIGEILSAGAVFPFPAPNFKGPLFYGLAEFDQPSCDGNCTGTYALPPLQELFWPSVSAIKDHVQKGSGHGLTLHSNAQDQYQAIFSFLAENGL